ncbi:MAG: efflux RND transporter periplasmic adaptor subunit [Anaerohalosphaeraceae bacterium]
MQRMVLPCFIMILAMGPCGCKKQTPPVEQTADVTIMTVVPRDVPITPEYVAQVQSSRPVNIQARVNGFLEKRVYTEGEIVKEGQTLFLMDQKPFQAQLDQANAALARQEAAFEIARKNLERVQPLVAADALSQKDLDEAKGHYESTAASVEQAKAAMEQARLNLSYTVITSPVTGITSSAQQADGTYLSMANSLLTSVAVISPAYVNFSLSENERLSFRNQVAKGLIVEPQDKNYVTEVILADGSIYSHTGQVTFAEPFFNPQTGTFLIRATVENPDGLLRPNQYVRVRLKGAIRPNAILVPQRAIQNASKGHFVWVVDKDNKVEQRPVVVGQWHENDWFIDEGLHAGDKVVVDGLLSLRPGMTVQIKSAAEQTIAPKTNM